MKVNEKKTKIIIQALKAYSAILNNKQYRSPDEIEMSKGLNKILRDIEIEESSLRDVDNIKNLGESYERETCKVCD